MTPRLAALQLAVECAEASLAEARSPSAAERARRELDALQSELARETRRDPHPPFSVLKATWRWQR
jgi:hypothetical protein